MLDSPLLLLLIMCCQRTSHPASRNANSLGGTKLYIKNSYRFILGPSTAPFRRSFRITYYITYYVLSKNELCDFINRTKLYIKNFV